MQDSPEEKGQTAINMGNTAEFDQLFRSFYAPLCFFAERFVGSKADAEDIVQALFTRLWNKAAVFESGGHAQAFLYRATHNACVDFQKQSLRSGKRQAAVLQESAPHEGSYLEELVRSEVWAEIYRAINRLPLQCAQVIRLSYMEGLKNDEIAQRLGVSLQAIKNYKHRGLRKLKDALPEKHFTLLFLLCI